ncbi:MAG: ABC-2 family transporter protein, partial [Bdellovibrionota bacterium]
MSVAAVFNIFLGLGISYKFSEAAGFAGGWKWLLVFAWLMVGLATAIVLRFAFSIWIFWTERSWALSRMYYQFFAIATKPDTIYPYAIRYFFLTILPFGFIGSVPARAVLHGISNQEAIHVFAVIATFGIIDGFLWNRGLKRYQSASS